MNELARQDGAELMEKVILGGDLSKLSSAERIQYHDHVCKSVGLNPLTKPFEYVSLQGKLRLYARRDACDQLRKIHGVSIKVIDKGEHDGLYIVSVGAQDRHGRTDEDVGAVQIAGLRGDARANAIAKAMTKAKRRVTLSICGLGFIDETEADDVSKTPVPYDLDKFFPDDEEKNALQTPQIAKEELPIHKAPEKQDSSDKLSEAVEGPYRLILGENEVYDYEDPEEFYTEYNLQQNHIAADESIAARDRMTKLKELEQSNEKSLELLPATGAKKLQQKRLAYNKKLGAEK